MLKSNRLRLAESYPGSRTASIDIDLLSVILPLTNKESKLLISKFLATALALVSLATPSSSQDGTVDYDETTSTTELLESGLPNDVGSDGAFTYDVPFKLPSFRGLEPSIGLSYNSSQKWYAENGPVVGIGWRVSGLSVIERKSIGGGAPSFISGEDVFMLDGQVLLACYDSGATKKYASANGLPTYPKRYRTTNYSASCAAGGQFVTQMDDGRRVEVETQGAFGFRVPKFTVTEQDGTKYTYISSGLARIYSGYQPPSSTDTSSSGVNGRYYGSRFVLSEIRDTQKSPNIVKFSYNGTAGEP